MYKPESRDTTPGKPANGQIIDDSSKTSQKKYKKIPSKKPKNDLPLCPFLCPHCSTLGPEYLKSRYEPLCIISDSGDSIYSPMHERYYDDQKSAVRDGRVFLAADVVYDLRKIKK